MTRKRRHATGGILGDLSASSNAPATSSTAIEQPPWRDPRPWLAPERLLRDPRPIQALLDRGEGPEAAKLVAGALRALDVIGLPLLTALANWLDAPSGWRLQFIGPQGRPRTNDKVLADFEGLRSQHEIEGRGLQEEPLRKRTRPRRRQHSARARAARPAQRTVLTALPSVLTCFSAGLMRTWP
jgi:hypothetical protein